MSDELDPMSYVRAPIVDVANGVSLGIALITATPKAAPETVRKAARTLRKKPLRAVTRAISGYSLQLVAMAANEPGRLGEVRAAWLPIDHHRADIAARRTAGAAPAGAPAAEPVASPTTVVPEVPE